MCRFDIVFIGPTPEMMNKMGDKSVAKELMKAAGVPLVPGSEVSLQIMTQQSKQLRKSDSDYVKSIGRRRGKGMRIVREASHLERH